MLAFARFSAGMKGCLVGMRQMLTMIDYVNGTSEDFGPYPLEFEITSPFWHFTDSVVTWSLRKVAETIDVPTHAGNADGVQFRYATSSALLFETLGPYTPPYNGKLPGNALTPDLEMIRDIRFPWRDDHAWEALSVPFEGPCDIALFAQVLQSSPATRQSPATPLNQLPFVLPEDAFTATNGPAPAAVLFRIAGSLIFQMENLQPDPRRLVTPQPPIIPTVP